MCQYRYNHQVLPNHRNKSHLLHLPNCQAHRGSRLHHKLLRDGDSRSGQEHQVHLIQPMVKNRYKDLRLQDKPKCSEQQ